MNALNRHPFMLKIAQERDELKRWTEANPELAAAWDDATADDQERKRQREEAARARWREEEHPKYLEEMGAPARAVRALFDRQRPTKAIGAVNDFLADPSKAFLLLVGYPGSGKTVAACAFLRSLPFDSEPGGFYAPARGHRGEFITAARLAVMPMFGEENERRWESISRCPNLVLDDLGVEAATDWWRGRLEELIDLRYGGDGFRTVITTNLGADQFKKHYGERIARRIREAGLVRSVGDQAVGT